MATIAEIWFLLVLTVSQSRRDGPSLHRRINHPCAQSLPVSMSVSGIPRCVGDSSFRSVIRAQQRTSPSERYRSLLFSNKAFVSRWSFS
ncbi:hypothetical protein V8C44DRAFT_324125 [Trichoderma aethiopicum]